MLKLYGTFNVSNAVTPEPYLVTLTENPNLPAPLKKKRALLANSANSVVGVAGFKAVLIRGDEDKYDVHSDVFRVPAEYAYLKEGDIVRLDPASGHMRCLFRKDSPHNTILLTEQCNHYCLGSAQK